MIQQGDVLLKKCDRVKGNKLDYTILAEGESTGHSHEIIWGDAALFQDEEDLYLEVYSETAGLKHEEHDWKNKLKRRGSVKNFSKADRAYLESIGIDLSRNYGDIIEATPPETIVRRGKFKIEIVQEYDHFAEEARAVRD